MRRWISSLALVVWLAASAMVADGAFTAAFDSLRAVLGERQAALAGATDKAGKKQLAAVTGSLAKLATLDQASDSSLALDLGAAKATFAKLEGAFPAEFPKNGAATGDLADALGSAVGVLKPLVESEFLELTGAIGRLPSGKLKTAAQKQANAAGKLLGKADETTRASSIVNLLQKAEKATAKGRAIVSKAPARNTVTGTFGTTAYVGQNNVFDFFPGSGAFNLITNGSPQALGGFLSFTLSPGIGEVVTGPGDYAVTGTLYVGSSPVDSDSYFIESGTVHLETIDATSNRATGTYTFSIPNHPELSTIDGAFDFVELRVQ